MQLYKTKEGILISNNNRYYLIDDLLDAIINRRNLYQYLVDIINHHKPIHYASNETLMRNVLAPIGSQEVWAAGVTYLRSRNARMEESKNSGVADVYQKVYEADRPELFFKANADRVSSSGEAVNIRKDSTWNVPEPELTLYINSLGEIQGYTIGNDMSSRSIEGENPLYLPQAKIYDRSCSLGPCIYVPDGPISPDSNISISIFRIQQEVFSGSIQLNRMKRSLNELASWLYRSCTFKHGCFLMTGTGLVPPNEFTLQKGDVINITIDGIGTLTNHVDVI